MYMKAYASTFAHYTYLKIHSAPNRLYSSNPTKNISYSSILIPSSEIAQYTHAS